MTDPALLLDPRSRTLDRGEALARVHLRAGPHPTEWFAFRSFGPLPAGRFDPHDLPTGPDKLQTVAYTGRRTDDVDALTVCLAEAYQRTRTINVRLHDPHFTVFTLALPVHLLALGHTTANRQQTQDWARQRYATTPPSDGVIYPSEQARSLGHAENICLWGPHAVNALPQHPLMSRPLSDPALLGAVQEACTRLGYLLIT